MAARGGGEAAWRALAHITFRIDLELSVPDVRFRSGRIDRVPFLLGGFRPSEALELLLLIADDAHDLIDGGILRGRINVRHST
eukprot:15483763-Alexandrium_andersonii.AAC.1